MLSIGLTGGIAAGKSLVARRLVDHGAVLIDADVLSREVLAAGSEGLAAVVTEFGEGVVTPDGALNRPALGALIFADDQARQKLNGIVHPRVRARATQLREAAPRDAVVVEDIPLLAETGQAAAFDLVLVVEAPHEQRIKRMVQDRGMTEHEARARIAVQATDEQRRAIADVVLVNDGTTEDLLADVDRVWAKYCNVSGAE